MTMLKSIFATGLSIGALSLMILPANADVVVERAITVPSEVIVPLPEPTTSTITVEKTITPAPAIVVPDAVSTIEERHVLMNVPATSGTTTVETTLQADAGSLPSFSRRLANMRSQIDLAAARGWMTEFRADDLRNQVERLAVRADNMRRQGFDRMQSDQIEREVNSLNIAISGAMESSPPIGSIPGFNE